MFKWFPTESAPRAFPMRLIRGELVSTDNKATPVPSDRNVFNGWGRLGSTHIVGDIVKPVPLRLDLAFYSFTEDKFFQGSFALPQARMTQFFAAGIPEDRAQRKPVPFDRIIVGMAPEGVVSVWMSAGQEVVELASYVAPQADLAWELVSINPRMSRPAVIRMMLESKLTREELARLEREGIPRNLFQSYRQLYSWKPIVTGSARVDGIQVHSFNGEAAWITTKGPVIPRDTRPVPSRIEVDLKASDGTPLLAEIEFDEAETFAAFRKLSPQGIGHPLGLHVEISRGGVAVSLKDEKYVLPLEKVRAEVLRR